MVKLPIFQTALGELHLMQTKWATILNGMLGNPSLQNNILSNVSLIDGSNVINHLLGRKLQGWRVIRINAVTHLYDTQDSNQTPELTLVLNSSDPAICTLEVF